MKRILIQFGSLLTAASLGLNSLGGVSLARHGDVFVRSALSVPPAVAWRAPLTRARQRFVQQARERLAITRRLWIGDPEMDSVRKPFQRRRTRITIAFLIDSMATLAVPLVGQVLFTTASRGAQAGTALRPMAIFSLLFILAEVLDPIQRFAQFRLRVLSSEFVRDSRSWLMRQRFARADALKLHPGHGAELYTQARSLAFKNIEMPVQLWQFSVHMVLGICVLARLDSLVAALTVFIGAVLVRWSRRHTRQMEGVDVELPQQDATTRAELEDLFSPVRIRHLRAHQLEEGEFNRMDQVFQKIHLLTVRQDQLATWFLAVIDKCTSLFLVSGVTLWGVWRLYWTGTPSPGEIFAIQALSWHVYFRVKGLFELRKKWASADSITRDVLRESIISSPPMLSPVETSDVSLSGDHLGFRVPGRVILRDVSFQVKAGQALIICGRSGAGKTTLLQLMAGIREPSEGVIHAHGRRGLISQETSLKLHRTLRENFKEWAADANDAEMLQVLERVHWPRLQPRVLDRTPDVLSGGERQRVALAAALLRHPQILIMDEPTASLDPISCRELLALWQELLQSGLALVISTHQKLPLTRARTLILKDTAL